LGGPELTSLIRLGQPTCRKTQNKHDLNLWVLVWLCVDRTSDSDDSLWLNKDLTPEYRVMIVALTLHRLSIPGAPGRQSTNFSSLRPKSTRNNNMYQKRAESQGIVKLI
jgi:hypothetical protein